MTYKLLGTGSAEGIPALFCDCETCAAAIQSGGKNIRRRCCSLIDNTIMIDFPPDMWTYKMIYGLDLCKLSSVFFTHSHFDHLAAGELCYYHKMYSNRSNPGSVLELYGNDKVLSVINSAFIFDMGHLPDCVSLKPLRAFETVKINDIRITPLPATHDPKEECFFFLVSQQEKHILQANDTGIFQNNVYDYLSGLRLDVVILDCTGGSRPSMAGGGHMSFEDNLMIRNRLAAQGSADNSTKFISNHISHNGHISYDDFNTIAAGTSFVSAYDGMEITV